MDREDTKIVGLDQDEVQKCSGYVDPIGLKLSDVQTVFGEIGGHDEVRTPQRVVLPLEDQVILAEQGMEMRYTD